MNDLDRTIRTALDEAGARVRTAPPFEGVRRRHTRRRTRRTATAAVALATVVAGVAVAAPGGSGGAPPAELASEEPGNDTMSKVYACIDGDPSAKPAPMMEPAWVSRDVVVACYTKYDVSPPPQENPWANDDPRADGTYRCDPMPYAGETTVASGRVEDVPWKVIVWQGRDETWCSSWRTAAAPNTQLMHFDGVDDFGRVGRARAGELSWTFLDDTVADRSDAVVWGAVAPQVATVRFMTRNGPIDVATVALPAQPDRRWVGAHLASLGDVPWHAEYLDASGTTIGRWPALP